MAIGTMHNGACYPTQMEAVNSWCGSYINQASNGSTSTCSQIMSAPLADAGGAVTFQWKRRTVDSAGTVTNLNISGQWLPSCETYGFDYFAPIVAAFTAALVLVIAGRLMFRALNTRGD